MKMFIITVVSVLCLSSLAVFALDPIKDNFEKIMGMHISDEKCEKNMKKDLTDSQKKSKELVDAKLKDGWEDIKKTHQIDEILYLKVVFGELDKFFDGKYENFSDKEFLEEVKPILTKNLFECKIPAHSLVPNILIKNDKNEILIAYKLKNGDNYVKKFLKKDGKWEENEKTLVGKAVMQDK